MKVRIITNGKKYRIERKFLFWWKPLVRLYTYNIAALSAPLDFSTYEDAVEYLKKEYGESALIVDWWHPVKL
jgi:hypothetical protein